MISFDCKNKTFKLDTPNTSYVIGSSTSTSSSTSITATK